jgi:hypothetical protein
VRIYLAGPPRFVAAMLTMLKFTVWKKMTPTVRTLSDIERLSREFQEQERIMFLSKTLLQAKFYCRDPIVAYDDEGNREGLNFHDF